LASVVSVPFPGGEPSGVDALGGAALEVVTNWVRKVAATLSVNPNVSRVEDSPGVILGVVIVLHVGDVNPITEFGIVAQHNEGFLDRPCFDHDPDGHASENLHQPGLPIAGGGVEDRKIIQVEVVELAGSPDHGLIHLELL
jgi:hypothetical protein